MRGRNGLRTLAWPLLLGIVTTHPERSVAQEDSVVVQAGARYRAGTLHRLLLGGGYRDLWTMPARVPVLSPDTFAGGLRVVRRGGGLQTMSLRFEAPDGSEFNFRSVNKNQSGGLHPDLRGTLVSAIVQDLVSMKHPAAAVVVARLQERAGILHPSPRLSVMVDDARLGEFRDEFAGMLGMVEEHANEGGKIGPFAHYERIIGSDRLLERLEESPEDRVDAPAYLRARLMDLLVGDWDRHPPQWRWAQTERGGRRYWLPVPEDRDNAFSHVGGVIGTVGGAIRHSVMRFGPNYPDLYGMVHNAQPLDRQILPEIDADEWAAVASDLQARITDEVIGAAVAEMPEAYQAANAEALAGALRARRDALPEAAQGFYELIAIAPDIYGTDEEDHAMIERLPGGSVRVRLAEKADKGAVYFERRFAPQETREVRIYLRGGDDEAAVHGGGPDGGVKIRILGGGGDDLLADSSSAGGVFMYDDQGENRFVARRATVIDRRSFAWPERLSFVETDEPQPRDWGTESSGFSPKVGWISAAGPVVGGGPSWTRYGFRRFPYANRTEVSILYAPLQTRFGLEVERRHLLTGGGGETRLHARATGLSVTRFFGFGNDTPSPADASDHRIWTNELAASVDLVREVAPGWEIIGGATASRSDPSPEDGFPVALRFSPGVDDFGAAGLHLGGGYDGRDSATYPRRGVRLLTDLAAFPLVWGDAPESFAKGAVEGYAYLPVPFPFETTLALRAGGERIWGTPPLQHAAFVGGSETLRGYHTQRYAGDASAFAGAELRTRLGRANLLVAKGDIGAIALVDAARVWWLTDDSDEWHAGVGGGLWFGPFNREITAHVVYAYGERHTISAGIGMPF